MQAGILRDARSDAIFVALALVHACVLLALPVLPVIAVGLWWNSNTISHNFIHRPFFRARAGNGAFSALLSCVLGYPQDLWRQMHLAHHAGARLDVRWGGQMWIDSLCTLAVWGALALVVPEFLLAVYLPGFLLGQCLCWLHGYYEHARGTTSNYGRLYNTVFFNDGYHVEHHGAPGTSWRELPRLGNAESVSRWPAVLRWLEGKVLDVLERPVLHARLLQRYVVARHDRAFRRLLGNSPDIRRAAIVGGGMFPRTALILRRLLPDAEIVIIDASAEHLDRARPFLPERVECTEGWFDPARHGGFDLVVVPLAFQGDRDALYRSPPAPLTLVHDWLWRRRGHGAVVSWLLLKRLNLATC